MKLAAIIRADTSARSINQARKVQELLLDQFGASLHSVRMAEPRLFSLACLKALDERPDALVVIGGNATARHAGEIAYQHKIPIAFLPGERPNIVARRLWGARSAETIIGLVARGDFAFARMDAGSAGNRIFLSSAACGVVAHLARLAEETREAHSSESVAKTMLRTLRLGGLMFRPRVTLRRRGASAMATAGLLAGVAASDRTSPRSTRQFPKLQCWVLPRQGPATLIKAMFRALAGRYWLAEPADYFEAGEITLEAGSNVWLALDGELMRMTAPLHVQILPGAIQTMVPRAESVRSSTGNSNRRISKHAALGASG